MIHLDKLSFRLRTQEVRSMRRHRGWIALDIDGTLTDASHFVPVSIFQFLLLLYGQGWEIIFITGRSFSFAYDAVQDLTFPYYLVLQNGADILYMPSKRLFRRCYLNAQMIYEIEKAHLGFAEDFIIYSGYEQGDFCFFRPKKFSKKILNHLYRIMPFSLEPWKEVDHFSFAPEATFPLIKCLGEKEEMQKLSLKLLAIASIAVTLIRDPLDEDRVYLNLITHEEATKGRALVHIVRLTHGQGPIIAAGDDLNDVSMLQQADFRIVMEHAPLKMHPLAHYIAKSGNIIKALEEAIKNVS